MSAYDYCISDYEKRQPNNVIVVPALSNPVFERQRIQNILNIKGLLHPSSGVWVPFLPFFGQKHFYFSF
jgi:hypothetical protein